MVDEFHTAEPHAMTVKARGTTEIARTQVVYTHTPDAQEAVFGYLDTNTRNGTGAQDYSVRVEQCDGNAASGSPFWVNVGNGFGRRLSGVNRPPVDGDRLPSHEVALRGCQE